MTAYRSRIKVLTTILGIAIICLAGRIAYLQLFDGKELVGAAAQRQTKLISGEDIPRGNIVDRKGISLTDSEVAPALMVVPSMLENSQDTAEKLAEILGASVDGIAALLNNRSHVFIPNLNEQQLRAVGDLKIYGVYPVQIQTRYGRRSLARHVIGHVNSIDSETWAVISDQKKESSDGDYNINDYIGVKGIEGIYEDYLHPGDPGFFLTEVLDGRGNVIPGLSFKRVKGSGNSQGRNSVYLTLDSKLQAKAEELMDAHIDRGAVVVMDIKTGDILAVASRPNFNQNLIADSLGSSSDSEAFNNRAFEYFNPGSVFKVLIASAVLEENLVRPHEKFLCTGSYRLNTGLSIDCWETKGHGGETFIEGFANSCNPVFIEMGLRLGREKILEYGKRFGLTGPKILGYPLSKHKCLSIDPFGEGKVANATLGQEGVMLSPVQVAGMISVVAGGGYYRTPRLVSKITDPQGHTLRLFAPDSGKRVLKANTAAQVRAMLEEAVINGTGKNAWVPGFGSAGKTGSAETGKTGADGKSIKNVWFAGYAPLKDPRFAIVVLKEEGDSGGGDAAPVFKEIAQFAAENLLEK